MIVNSLVPTPVLGLSILEFHLLEQILPSPSQRWSSLGSQGRGYKPQPRPGEASAGLCSAGARHWSSVPAQAHTLRGC